MLKVQAALLIVSVPLLILGLIFKWYDEGEHGGAKPSAGFWR